MLAREIGQDPVTRYADSEQEALCLALPRVVGEHGWARTTPDRVAREAGLAPVEFWDHFRSLEHCYAAVYDATVARLTRTATRAVATRTGGLGRDAWQEQLGAGIGAALAFLALEPVLARTCVVEVLAAGERARDRRDATLACFTSQVEGLRFTHGEPIPPLAAELIVLGTYTIVYRHVAHGQTERLPEVLPDLRRMWLASVGQAVAPRSAAAFS